MTPWALHRNSHSPRSAGLRFPPTYTGTLAIRSCLGSFICRIASSIINTSSVIINILDTWVPCASVGDISVALPAPLTSAGNHFLASKELAPPPHPNVPSILAAPLAHFIPSRNIYSSRQSSYICYYLSIRSRCVFRLSRNFLFAFQVSLPQQVSARTSAHITQISITVTETVTDLATG